MVFFELPAIWNVRSQIIIVHIFIFYYSFDLARIPALEQALGMLMIAEKKSTAKLRF